MSKLMMQMKEVEDQVLHDIHSGAPAETMSHQDKSPIQPTVDGEETIIY